MSIRKFANKEYWWIPIALGLAAYLTFVGFRALNPLNIAWLQVGDPATHYLGWAFFRNSPWQFPLGLNPNYGMHLSSSIVFSDSVPLFAFFFKIFSNYLPEPFQYLGIWLLSCFLLQAWFVWLLLGLFNKDVLVKTIGTCLLLVVPPLIFRLPMHSALVGHWVILAAIYLTLKPNLSHSFLKWNCLLILAVLINFYFIPMVFALWAASLFQSYLIAKKIQPTRVALELIASIFSILMTMWVAGFFSISMLSMDTYGFSQYRMNILAPFNPMGWSYLLPDLYINSNKNEYEGFNYFGLGIIFLLATLVMRPHDLLNRLSVSIRSYPILFIALIALTLMAISNNIGIGSENYLISTPKFADFLLGIWRSSGRLFWPAWYVCVLFILVGVIGSYKNKYKCIAILFIALFLQLADSFVAWRQIRERLNQNPASQFNFALTNSFWRNAPEQYKNVVRLPGEGRVPDWATAAYFASQNNMVTDSVYLARINKDILRQKNEQLWHQIHTGQYQSDTLYFVENYAVIPVLAHLNVQDNLYRVDGINLLVPNYKDCAICNEGKGFELINSLVPTYDLDQKIIFSREGINLIPFVLIEGWYYPEPWGVWMDSRSAKLLLPLPKNAQKLEISARAFISKPNSFQPINIVVNGEKLPQIELTQPENNLISINITPKAIKEGYLQIEFVPTNPARPIDLGMGNDDRLLSIGLVSATFH